MFNAHHRDLAMINSLSSLIGTFFMLKYKVWKHDRALNYRIRPNLYIWVCESETCSSCITSLKDVVGSSLWSEYGATI